MYYYIKRESESQRFFPWRIYTRDYHQIASPDSMVVVVHSMASTVRASPNLPASLSRVAPLDKHR